MRFVRMCVYLILSCLLVILDASGAANPAFRAIASRLEAASVDKSVVISGIQTVQLAEVRRQLPERKSVIWWLLNKPWIEARLVENPYIQRARVENCDPWLVRSWGCFTVKVEERKPTYIAMIAKDPWLIGEDGGFISPLSDPRASRFVRENAGSFRPKIIRGLMGENQSPETIKARFERIRSSIRLVEASSEMEIEWVQLKDNGELDVRFREPRLMATFDSSEDESGMLQGKAKRLRQLVDELGEKKDLLARVDLAFENVAVVGLKKQ